MDLKKLSHRQVILGLSVICLSFVQTKSAISLPTAKEYEQFRGGVDFPDCDHYFDIPKFIAVQREGGLTGKIGHARFDGEEAKSFTLAVNSGCEYYRTKSGILHKVGFFRFGDNFYYPERLMVNIAVAPSKAFARIRCSQKLALVSITENL
jgi:hypothetical protein